MTTPIRDDDIDITIRVQPVVARSEGWRGRSNSLIAVGLVGFIAVGVILGTAFDDAKPTGPAFVAASVPVASAKAGPTTRPTPSRSPRPSPLPTIEIIGGQIPTEQRLVYADGLELLDLSTGTLKRLQRSYEDLVFPADNGQFVCACIDRSTSADVRFARFDEAGKDLAETDLAALDGATAVADMTEGFNVVAAFDRPGDRLFVMTAVRRPPAWSVELIAIDAATGDVIDRATLDTFPVGGDEPSSSPSPSPTRRLDGTPPDGVYLWAESVTVSSDASSLLASVSWSETIAGNWTNNRSEWMVPMTEGSIGKPIELAGDVALGPSSWCFNRPSFLDGDVLVAACSTSNDAAGTSDFFVRRLTSAGESLGNVPIPPSRPGNQYPTATLDRPGRRMFIWDLTGHELVRVGIDDGKVDRSAVSQSMLPPDQRAIDGQGYFGADPGVVISPNGSRVYALGAGRGSGPSGSSTGVWVFDATTLELVDHWEPRAFLSSLAVSDDGAFIYAIGAAGRDTEGNENSWPASVTVYDAATGEIQVLYGAIGEGQWLAFPTWP
jgi:hypothetical protein